MTQPKYGLLAIGNAMVDVLSRTSEDYIAGQDAAFGMKKNSMNLIGEDRALTLYGEMGERTQASGGSAANTMAGFASFGGKGVFTGKVGDDELGAFYRRDLNAIGADFFTPATTSGMSTGRCMILITPDGARTMNTFLGAGVELCPADIDEAIVADAQVTYLEGYLFDPAPAQEAFYKAAKCAHAAGRKVSLSLSDPFCVGRHRAAFRDLVEGHIDILFANEEEAKSLYEVETLEEVFPLIQDKCDIVAITRSEKGSVILSGGKIIEIKPEPVAKVVDTTGAGDMYAAGFLFGYTEGKSLEECGRLGSLAAAEVIAHIGPRPLISLKTLLSA